VFGPADFTEQRVRTPPLVGKRWDDRYRGGSNLMTQHQHENPLKGLRAAVAVGPMFEETEALYPYYRLQEAGAVVGIIGVEAEQTVTGKQGYELEVEQAAADILADDLDLLVIAGGYGPDKLRADDGMLRLVRDLHEQGKPIAFICHAAGCRPRPASSPDAGSPPIRRLRMTCATPARIGKTPRSSWTATSSPRAGPMTCRRLCARRSR
jgi:hypothetical protein